MKHKLSGKIFSQLENMKDFLTMKKDVVFNFSTFKQMLQAQLSYNTNYLWLWLYIHNFRGSCPELFIKQLFEKFSEIYKKNTGGTVLLVKLHNLSK